MHVRVSRSGEGQTARCGGVKNLLRFSFYSVLCADEYDINVHYKLLKRRNRVRVEVATALAVIGDI